MKPSNFKKDPMGSVHQKSESETIARNIMVILARTGDTFRPLSWEEYKEERTKDGNFSNGEKSYFDAAIDFCKSPDTARLFSPVWEQAYLKAEATAPANAEQPESPVPVQPDENELRDKSLKWWVNLGHEQAWTLREKYFPHRSLLTADERLKIYLAEHSSPVPVKDNQDAPTLEDTGDGFTGGNWLINELSMNESAFEILTDTPNGQNMNGYIAYIKCSNYTVPGMAKANALLISEAKNMYNALKAMCELAERLQDGWSNESKKHGGYIGGSEGYKIPGFSPDCENAKAIINRINKH